MKTFTNWDDLREYGINPLTGEACGYSLRILCDLSDTGVTLMAGFFGLNDKSFKPSWNTKVSEEKSTASIMLPYSIFQQLVTYIAFLKDTARAVGYQDQSPIVHVATTTEDLAYLLSDPDIRIISNPTLHSKQPVVGGRSVHAMSGRIE